MGTNAEVTQCIIALVLGQGLDWWSWFFSALLCQSKEQNAWSSWYGWRVKPKRRSTHAHSAYKTAVNPGPVIGLLTQFHGFIKQVSLYTWKVLVVVVLLNSAEADLPKKPEWTSHLALTSYLLDTILLKLMRIQTVQSYWTAALNLLKHDEVNGGTQWSKRPFPTKMFL